MCVKDQPRASCWENVDYAKGHIAAPAKRDLPSVCLRKAGSIRSSSHKGPVSVLHHLGHTHHLFSLGQMDEADPLGVPADHLDIADPQPDDLAACGDDHELVLIRDLIGVDDLTVPFRSLDGEDPLSSPSLDPVLPGEGVDLHLRRPEGLGAGDPELAQMLMDRLQRS